MVAKLRGNKQESSFQDVHARGHRDCVEILELDLGDHVLVSLQGDLEYVALLGLQ